MTRDLQSLSRLFNGLHRHVAERVRFELTTSCSRDKRSTVELSLNVALKEGLEPSNSRVKAE